MTLLNSLQNEVVTNTQLGYIFEFYGIEKPITIFAINYQQAEQFVFGHPLLVGQNILNVSCFRIIKYVTEKNVFNGDFVFVGFENSPDGWVTKQVYLNTNYN